MKSLITGAAGQRQDGRFVRIHQSWIPDNWNDGWIDNKGRFRVFRPDCPRAFKNGYALRAHVVYWLTNGKVHPDGTNLHHINQNKLDDRIENIVVMDHGAHTILHCAKLPMGCICKTCGEVFPLPKWRLRESGRGSYCSQECYQSAPKRRIASNCAYCGEVFQKANPDHIFCSVSCRSKQRRKDFPGLAASKLRQWRLLNKK